MKLHLFSVKTSIVGLEFDLCMLSEQGRGVLLSGCFKVCACTQLRMHTAVKGHLVGVASLLLSRGSQGLNSGPGLVASTLTP